MTAGAVQARCNGEGQGITHDIGTPGALDPRTGTEGAAAGAAPAIGIERAATRLFGLSVDLLVAAGFDGYVKHANPAWEHTLGWTADDLRARPYLELVHPDDRERTAAEALALAGGDHETRDFELRFAHKDGGWRWILFSAQADLEDQILYAVGKDISDRRRVEQELRDSIRRFETVTESVNDAIVSAEDDGRIAFWNDGARSIFGYEQEDILGRSLTTLMPERLVEAHRRGFARYLETGRASVIGRTVELVGVRSDGSEFPLELSLGEWRRGKRRAFTGVIRDLTERKRTERYLAAQFRVASVLVESPTLEDAAPRFLAAIGESMGWQVGGLWTPDPDGEHLHCRVVWHAEGAQVEAFEAATLELALARGEGLPGRVWESGEPVWVRDAGSEPNFPRGGAAAHSGLHGGIGLPLVSGGATVGVFDFFSPQIQEPDPDLTNLMGAIGAQLGAFVKRKLAEDELAATTVELRARAADLERSNADLEQFAYVASHDLSEPLRMVAGFVQLLRKRYEGRLDDDADEFIGYTVDGVNRMQALIDDLLAFSRVGRGDRELTDVDAGAAARRARDALSAPLAETGADVEIGELPTVRGDERELGQLFQNLISNALKFHGDDPPRVRVTADAEDGGAEWRFAVADNGIGIEPRHAERIFKMFQRLHGRDAYAGTGIGLAICKKIVEHHGGRIWVEPNADAGSVFRFTLAASRGTNR
jgi:PAS domain S-box-containing protein